MSDEDEANPYPPSPPTAQDPINMDESLNYQHPSQMFDGFLLRAKVICQAEIQRDKAIFWSGAGTLTAKGQTFYARSLDHAKKNELVHSSTIFGKLSGDKEVDLTETQRDERIGLISGAMGRTASGDIRVMLPIAGMAT